MTNKDKIKQEIERIEQILDDFNKTHNNTIDNGIVSAKKNICKHIKSFIDSLPEEPASEDLEEAALKYRWEHPFCDGYTAYSFKAGAEWQKEKDKQLIGATQKISHQHGYDEGRSDMREEMMKGAVDATVYKGLYSKYIKERDYESLSKALENFEEHDRVKIIIVKEEQQ